MQRHNNDADSIGVRDCLTLYQRYNLEFAHTSNSLLEDDLILLLARVGWCQHQQL